MRNTRKAFLGTSKEMQGVDIWDMTKTLTNEKRCIVLAASGSLRDS